MRLLTTFLTLTSLSLFSSTHAFPNTPFNVSGRWIHDSTGANFTYAGANWPGAADVMIPEGLQYQSIANIVSKIKSLGMNVVRLTFAIEMIDDVLDHGGDVKVTDALNKALGTTNGTKVWGQIVKNNPSFGAGTTRLQVFDAVAAELNKQGIYVHLDNHMSRGYWCCSSNDGNSWFGDTYFDTAKWKRGVAYMAQHGKAWPNLISIGLRNEFRQPDTVGSSLPYDWPTWYTHMTSLSTSVNAANPDILIFLSGLNYDTTLAPIPMADNLGNGQKFTLSSFPYAHKLVLELHNYQNSATSCSSMESGMWNGGFKAIDASAVNRMPVVLTEFGFSQSGSDYTSVYASCIRSLMQKWKTGWTVWVLSGSYYIRSGTQDYEESWGLFNHQWTDWRSQGAINALKGLVTASVAE
ncbi:glycoside hydrolase family 5 protein [Periconia macrospinosa]|uniref:Glycoside hydrolase family 5 protein n=1 Tax=Periconia macrospinosa TaxID=97972 RepID=A0A2V1D6J3_9PLEO|nr:glycoside hydrolase family 5 protein [Periconia macrospinosa]